jgi:Arc/MetJ family transcription regulator
MVRRTTIEIDQELLARAKRALGAGTTRATVEQALRQAAEAAEGGMAERRGRQLLYLEGLGTLTDVEVLRSDEMWR